MSNEAKENQQKLTDVKPEFPLDQGGTDKSTLNEFIPSSEDFKHMIQEERVSTENIVDAELLDLEVKSIYNESSEEKIMPFHPLRDYRGRYPCNKCNYKAKNPSLLKLHVDGIHEGVRYPCEQCEYKATQKSSLNRHKMRHSNI